MLYPTYFKINITLGMNNRNDFIFIDIKIYKPLVHKGINNEMTHTANLGH